MGSVTISWILELVPLLAGAAVAVSGCLWAAFRFGSRIYRILPAVDRLHDLFGGSPIEQLHKLVTGAHATIGELEIRQRIAERHLGIGVYTCWPDGTCQWANDYLCDAFGLDSQDMREFGWLSAIAKDDRERVHAEWMRAIENHLPYSSSYTVINADSGRVWKAVTEAWAVKSKDKIVCYVGYVAEQR